MQLKNNSELDNFQIMAFANRGVTTKVRDGVTGEIVDRQVKPDYKLIHVPPLATVEIADELWLAATYDTKRTVPVFEVTKEVIEGVMNGKDKLYRTVRTDTGKTKEVCLIQDMIDKGHISIIKHPKATITTQEMVEALKLQHINVTTDTPEEVIETLYNKNCR